MKLLHISASPRGERSESLAIANTFLDVFREVHPDVDVEQFDLWDGTLPAFGPEAAAAKMAVFAGETPTSDAWRAAVDTFHRFDSADRYLFSVPMWNHGVPYILKQFIDVVSQPGLVFGFDPERGPGFGNDFHATYFSDWLRWAGVDDIAEISFRPNLAIADAEPGRRAAHAAARDAAKLFH